MAAKDKTEKKAEAPDAAARMDAAVRKAESAERRLHGAEDGPLQMTDADDSAEPGPDSPAEERGQGA